MTTQTIISYVLVIIYIATIYIVDIRTLTTTMFVLCIFKPGVRGHKPSHAWFLEITFVYDVSMYVNVCLPPRLVISMYSLEINCINQLNK